MNAKYSPIWGEQAWRGEGKAGRQAGRQVGMHEGMTNEDGAHLSNKGKHHASRGPIHLPKTYCDSFSLPPLPSLTRSLAHLFSEVLLDEVEGLQPRPLMCFEPLLLQVRLLLWVVDGNAARRQSLPTSVAKFSPRTYPPRSLEDRLHDLDAVDRAEL